MKVVKKKVPDNFVEEEEYLENIEEKVFTVEIH